MTKHRVLTGIAGGVAIAIAAHLAIAAGYERAVAVGEISLAMLALIAWAVRTRQRQRILVSCIALALVMIGLALRARLPIYLPSVAINLLLAWLFGHTLLGRGVALISRVARLEHGAPLDEATLRYTRTLTVLWFVFFLGSAAISLALPLLVSREAWSWFANVLNFPLALALFGGEYLHRRRRFRDRSHATPLATISRFAAASATVFESHGAGSP